MSSFSKKTNQFYMRCSFYKRKDDNGKCFKCPAMIYSIRDAENKLVVQKFYKSHNHCLSTKEDIMVYYENSRKLIPDETKKVCFGLFKEGEAVKDIYKLIKNDYKTKNKELSFTFLALKNYLYDSNKGLD